MRRVGSSFTKGGSRDLNGWTPGVLRRIAPWGNGGVAGAKGEPRGDPVPGSDVPDDRSALGAIEKSKSPLSIRTIKRRVGSLPGPPSGSALGTSTVLQCAGQPQSGPSRFAST